jgi:Ca-activated chloride channel homolog
MRKLARSTWFWIAVTLLIGAGYAAADVAKALADRPAATRYTEMLIQLSAREADAAATAVNLRSRGAAVPAVHVIEAPAASQVGATGEDDLGGHMEGMVHGQSVDLPLLKTEMEAWVDGDLASVVLVQEFSNPHDAVMHARYIFPLPTDAAVHDMEMVVGDRVIRAEIQQADEAKQTFETAQAEGKQAALLTQHRPNVFTQEIANLRPGHAIRVEIHYAHPVPRRDGEYRFVFPMVVGPRYLAAAAPLDGEPEPLEIGQWNLPASPPLAHPDRIDSDRVSIEVHLDGGVPVRGVASRSHALAVSTVDERRREITLVEGRTIDNQDFEFSYDLAGDGAVAGVTAWRGDPREPGVLSLIVEPPVDAPASDITAREIVFVLDCSGSMSGIPMEASKRLVRRSLEGLRPTDFFRIIRFSSGASEFEDRPLAATDANVRRGLSYVDGLHGTGGTEMAHGIRAALDPAPAAGAMRIVVFLTDGYIGDEASITRLIQAKIGDARLFSFGVGNGVNRFLLEEISRAGRGVARIVRPDEDEALAADRLMERLESPYLTDVWIDWGEAEGNVYDATPVELPDLFLGQPLRVLARYDRPGTFLVTVHGLMAGKPVTLPVEIELPRGEIEGAPTAEALPITWARAQVEDRMHAYTAPWTHADERDDLERQVTELGLEHRLVTQWTSFVAVDEEIVVDPVAAADAAMRDVAVPPVQGVSPAAWGGQTFGGHAAPEPEEWAALLLVLGLAIVALKPRRRTGGAA